MLGESKMLSREEAREIGETLGLSLFALKNHWESLSTKMSYNCRVVANDLKKLSISIYHLFTCRAKPMSAIIAERNQKKRIQDLKSFVDKITSEGLNCDELKLK